MTLLHDSEGMARAYLLLGSNSGDTEALLDEAIRLITLRAGSVGQRSSRYLTAAWGFTDQPDFLNQALEVFTFLSPRALLDELLSIEKDLGRQRKEKWASRTMDIDIIFYDNLIVNEEGLRIPHPLMQERRFVLQPLVEIAADFRHPESAKSLAELLDSLVDNLSVKKVS